MELIDNTIIEKAKEIISINGQIKGIDKDTLLLKCMLDMFSYAESLKIDEKGLVK